LVTINYRLGASVFFAHPELSSQDEHGVSGNYGLLDQLQALKWIHRNIEPFGGDRDNVTIFGQSAGGGSVQALMASPLSKGLFHKAIVQSAGGINTLGGKIKLSDAEEYGIEVCDKTGLTLEEMKQMPADKLFEIISPYGFQMESGKGFRIRFGPNVDGYFLEDAPGSVIASGNHHDIPYLTGSVGGDGGLFSPPDADEPHKQAVSKLAPRGWAKAHHKLGRNPLYVYYFNRDIPGTDRPGAFHSSELWYIFGTLARCWRPMLMVDYKLSLAMTDYWTNFAMNGDPNGADLPAWPAFTEQEPYTMELNENGISAVDHGGDATLAALEERLFQEVYGS